MFRHYCTYSIKACNIFSLFCHSSQSVTIAVIPFVDGTDIFISVMLVETVHMTALSLCLWIKQFVLLAMLCCVFYVCVYNLTIQCKCITIKCALNTHSIWQHSVAQALHILISLWWWCNLPCWMPGLMEMKEEYIDPISPAYENKYSNALSPDHA